MWVLLFASYNFAMARMLPWNVHVVFNCPRCHYGPLMLQYLSNLLKMYSNKIHTCFVSASIIYAPRTSTYNFGKGAPPHSVLIQDVKYTPTFSMLTRQYGRLAVSALITLLFFKYLRIVKFYHL